MKENDIDFFDVKNEFFVIDSESLSDVKPHLYGYSVQEDGVYENCDLTEEAISKLDGRGCYVYVDVHEDDIRIQQDFNGCYGLCIYRHGDYFAVSNSFLRLLEHVVSKYPTSLNRDYANHFFLMGLASQSATETLISEISLINRNSQILIDKNTCSIKVGSIACNEASYSLDTKEGMDILDRWFAFWTRCFYELSEETDRIEIDLSGGYDSRLSFLLMLESGVDLNKIRVHSATDDLHTHSEDYEIASQIANYYGFRLNKKLPDSRKLNYSFNDILNIEFYTKMCFHKEPRCKATWSEDRIYHIGGDGGESIREYYQSDADGFIERTASIAKKYPNRLQEELCASIKRILQSSYTFVREKYGINNEGSSDYPQFLYRDGRGRNHFGRGMVGNYFSNIFKLTPLMDPDLWKLQLDVQDCQDKNLLMALIYVRYCPRLMEFPFEGHKYTISDEVMEYARKLNKKFPFKKVENIRGGFQGKRGRLFDASFYRRNNGLTSSRTTMKFLKDLFDHPYIKAMFTSQFDEQIYDYAKNFFDFGRYYSIRHCYSVVGVATVIGYIHDRYMQEGNLASRLQDVVKRKPYHVYNSSSIIKKFSSYFAARIDLKLSKLNPEDIQYFFVTDDRAVCQKPIWFQKTGVGYIITSYCGDLKIGIKTNKKGQGKISLRGVDVRDSEDKSKRIPYWIDYTSFSVNDRIVIEERTPAWHDLPFQYEFEFKEGEEILIDLSWMPHR